MLFLAVDVIAQLILPAAKGFPPGCSMMSCTCCCLYAQVVKVFSCTVHPFYGNDITLWQEWFKKHDKKCKTKQPKTAQTCSSMTLPHAHELHQHIICQGLCESFQISYTEPWPQPHTWLSSFPKLKMFSLKIVDFFFSLL